MVGSPVFFNSPLTRLAALVGRNAKGVGMLVLGGYVVIVLFAFGAIGPDVAAPAMALFAGAKLYMMG